MIVRQTLPQNLEGGCGGSEPVAGPDQLPTFVGEAGLMRCTDGDVDAQSKDHGVDSLVCVVGHAGSRTRRDEVDPHQTFANRDPRPASARVGSPGS